jgi:hypothetical protein
VSCFEQVCGVTHVTRLRWCLLHAAAWLSRSGTHVWAARCMLQPAFGREQEWSFSGLAWSVCCTMWLCCWRRLDCMPLDGLCGSEIQSRTHPLLHWRVYPSQLAQPPAQRMLSSWWLASRPGMFLTSQQRGWGAVAAFGAPKRGCLRLPYYYAASFTLPVWCVHSDAFSYYYLMRTRT